MSKKLSIFTTATLALATLALLSLAYATESSSTNSSCELVNTNLIRHGIKMVRTYEQGDFTRSFIETMKMSQVLPFAVSECSLKESNELQALPSTSQALLTEIYEMTKNLVAHPENHSYLLQNGNDLIQKINKLLEIGLDDSTQDTTLEGSADGVEERAPNAFGCIICGGIMRLAQNEAIYKKQDIADYMGKTFCKHFPSGLVSTCNKFVSMVGPVLVENAAEKYNADFICRKIGACTGIYAQCSIEGPSPPNPTSPSPLEYFIGELKGTNPPKFVAPWNWLIQLYNSFSEDHLPIVDLDQDGFSTQPQYRGYNWRGKDCNDFVKGVRPGVDKYNGNQSIDYNCNGIYGVNTVTGNNYKEELCGGTQQYGIITIGDSAGAHFEINPAYLNVTMWNEKPFNDIISVLANSFDLPMKSASTGYEFDQPQVDSLYKKLIQLNRCNANNYQNLGVNGAMSTDSLHNVQALRINQKTDFPVFVVFELIGNDVCDYHHSFDTMTKPDVFREKILEIWNHLDTVLPTGSHMIIWGVADGRILYDTLKDKIEPLGLSYPDFYDYLNCLGISPCWGYMNTDEYIRDITAGWAATLNQVYKDILADETITFNNFDIVYYDLPIQEIIDIALLNGYTAQDIIEPVDGFHPSQLANDYLAEVFWANIKRDRPEWIPLPNPNNDLIDTLFGNPILSKASEF